MISEAEALERVLASVVAGPAEPVPLDRAHGRFVAGDHFATFPLPCFDNSSMDGYALRAADGVKGARLRVTGEQSAGDDLSLAVEPGECVRIFTGGPIPRGADAVIMQEDVERTADENGAFIRCLDAVEPGENIRRAGCDLCTGQMIARSGSRLTAPLIGLLASQGIADVRVGGLPRVAILSTGDELAPAGAVLKPGQIFNSNGPMLATAVRDLGACEVRCVHCRDELRETTETLKSLLESADIIIVSGGVSVGDRDQIKPALLALGIKPDLWRVSIKPGKPFLFAKRDGARSVLIFGLPGNPVSAFVTFQIFVRPALLRWMGADDVALPQRSARLAASVANKGDRPHYLRGRLRDGEFAPSGLQESHALFGLSQANALLRLEPGEKRETGDWVVARSWEW